MIILITGGIKSGKSNFGQKLAETLRKKEDSYYLATALPIDDEMRTRIKRHQNQRGKSWITIEEHLDIVSGIKKVPDKKVVLIDCLTVWLNNFMYENEDKVNLFEEIEQIFNDVFVIIKDKKLKAIFITNEVGWGIIPDNQLSRKYIDYLGNLNKKISANSDEVYLMVSGIETRIK